MVLKLYYGGYGEPVRSFRDYLRFVSSQHEEFGNEELFVR